MLKNIKIRLLVCGKAAIAWMLHIYMVHGVHCIAYGIICNMEYIYVYRYIYLLAVSMSVCVWPIKIELEMERLWNFMWTIFTSMIPPFTPPFFDLLYVY